MRNYLFRAKRKDNGEWIEGWIIQSKTTSRGIITEIYTLDMRYEVDPETVGQLTGLKDNNSERIFEGDIVKFEVTDIEGPYQTKGVIEYSEENGAYLIHCREEVTYYDPNYHSEMQVVGNIYDEEKKQ